MTVLAVLLYIVFFIFVAWLCHKFTPLVGIGLVLTVLAILALAR